MAKNETKHISDKEIEQIMKKSKHRPTMSSIFYRLVGEVIGWIFVLFLLGVLIKGLVWAWNFLW
jgi:hypothetical protein